MGQFRSPAEFILSDAMDSPPARARQNDQQTSKAERTILTDKTFY